MEFFEKEKDFHHVWCQACMAIVHKEACLHKAGDKRPLLDVVFCEKGQCQACYQYAAGWFVQYNCGHMVHLDICYHETCPELCTPGSLLDSTNLSPSFRMVRKSRQVTAQVLRQPVFNNGGSYSLIALAARYLSSGGHLHIALHTDSNPDLFHIYPQDTIFPVCETGHHLSKHLHEFVERQLGLPAELPHGLDSKDSPFQLKYGGTTEAVFYGFRTNRRVYLCFGQVLGKLLTNLIGNTRDSAIVCFSGAYDYHRHLQRRPPALTIPATNPLVRGITSRQADFLY